MLRISPNTPPPEAPLPEEILPPEVPMPEEEVVEDEPQVLQIRKVDPTMAGYRLPPFECGKCDHYEGKGSCELVDGPIDEKGTCNLFVPQDSGEEVPIEEDVPTEVPAEDVPLEEVV